MIYRDANAGGGTGNPGAAADANPNADADAGKTADAGGDGTPTFKTDAEALGWHKSQLEATNAKLSSTAADHDKLKSKLGTQSNQIGELNQIKELARSNPQGLIASLAKEAGLTVNFGDPNANLGFKDIFSDNLSPEEKEKKFSEIQSMRDSQTAANILKQVDVGLQPFHDDRMKARYPDDWDELGDERQGLVGQMKLGTISLEEVGHLALKASHIAESVEAARKEGYAQGEADLTKKFKEQYGGTAGHDAGTKQPEADKEKLDTVVGRLMHKDRRGI